MIVICTGCQARFRVADEKVGPRGAKVRCSRCQTVFVVKREAAAEAPRAEPNIELDLTPGLGGPSPARRSGPAPAGASVIPFPAASAQPRPPPPDPFAAAGLDAFGEPAPAAAEDPFAHVAAAPSGPDLRPAGLGEPMAIRGAAAPPPDDPFAQVVVSVADTFGGMSSGTTGAQALPVTDLSQLLGSTQGAPSSPPAVPPVPPAARAAREAVEAQLGTEPQVGAEPAFGAEPPPAEPQLGAEPQPAGPAFSADLALEEHSAGHQAPFADPADVVMSAEAPPAGFGGAAFEAGPLGSLSGPEESLSLAEPTPGLPEAERPPPVSPLSLPVVEAPPRQVAAARGPEENEAAEPGPARAGPLAANWLRAAAVNALALVALLAVALGFWVVLRGDASLGPSALRPSTLLRTLGRAPPQAGTFEVAGVHAGVYGQSSGGMVLFVRGEVLSRAPAPVAAVRVEAELVRDGKVLARGEARAGVVPSPEEIDRATDRDALDALAAAVRKRAPKAVAPGDRLGFLVTIGDAPADVSGASVLVRAEADGAGE